MVRNDSLARIVMLLCFGTAILSLTLHWRISTSIPKTVQDSSTVSTKEPFDFLTQQIRDFVSVGEDIKKESFPKSKLPLKTQAASPQQSKAKPVNNNNVSFEKKVVVDLGDRRAYVYRQNTVIASYPIGVGKKGWETPTGTFEVLHMQHDPAWQHPITGKIFPAGPNSPLGERWIGFWSDGHNEIGFHGTPESDLVGSPVSHGCLRMRNSDVLLLYEQIDLGVPVEVRK
ncbi:MAG: L,D-transpeptidase [Nostocales cyanobacterium 94392]|nr:L,D-transpeptidase [Nostocales cyanobacterium 94392]